LRGLLTPFFVMEQLKFKLEPDERIYFASDFHLGTPSYNESRIRENQIINWLDAIEKDAKAIFLVGDIFDFWFEYKDVIPKGFIRFQSKLLQLKEKGIDIYFFQGNHDMWMFDYFPREFEIPVYSDPILLEVNDLRVYVGHGDGLGPGDKTYKVLKKIFRNPLCQWLFGWIHPNVGMLIAKNWSSRSRIKNESKSDSCKEHDEWLWIYSKEIEKTEHHDYYIFGHRHLPLEMSINNKSTYINLGEWVFSKTYAVLFEDKVKLLKYEDL